MNFGHFDDANKEYVITTPDTPLPWINYLGSQDFFTLISNTCGGYSFYKDAKLLRITRYRYNNIPVDSNGNTTISKMGIPYGIQVQCQPALLLMFMSAAMDLATAVSTVRKTAWQLIFLHSSLLTLPARSTN